MPSSTPSTLQLLYSELLALATAVGELRARFHHVSQRLDHLERQQSELAAASLKTTPPDPTMLERGRRFLPQILTTVGEKLIPYIIPAAIVMFTFGKKIFQAVAEWALVGWYWLIG